MAMTAMTTRVSISVKPLRRRCEPQAERETRDIPGYSNVTADALTLIIARTLKRNEKLFLVNQLQGRTGIHWLARVGMSLVRSLNGDVVHRLASVPLGRRSENSLDYPTPHAESYTAVGYGRPRRITQRRARSGIGRCCGWQRYRDFLNFGILAAHLVIGHEQHQKRIVRAVPAIANESK